MKRFAGLLVIVAASALAACSGAGSGYESAADVAAEDTDAKEARAGSAEAAPETASAKPSSAPGARTPGMEAREDSGDPGGERVQIAEDGVPLPVDNR